MKRKGSCSVYDKEPFSCIIYVYIESEKEWGYAGRTEKY